jgi:spore coat protein SA
MKNIAFIFPAGCYPVPAIKGGAVEALITNLIEENEKNKKFIFHVIMCKYKSDKTNYDYSGYKYTKFYDFYQGDKQFKFDRLVNAINKRLNYAIDFYSPYEKFIIRTVKDINPEQIIFEGTFNVSVKKLKKLFSKEKIILHVHHQILPKYKLDKHIGSMLCVSEFIKQDWIDSGKMSDDFDYKVLNNVLTSDNFFNKISSEEKKELKLKYNLTDDDFVLVYCGRLVKEKGIGVLINAIKNLKEKNIKLMIIGESGFKNSNITPFVSEIKEMVCDDERVFFTGFIDNHELYKYYSIANLQVIPSLCEESAGLVALEGRAVGLPQLITNSGALPDYASKKAVIVNKEKNLQENLESEIQNFFNGKYSKEIKSEKNIPGAEEYYEQFSELFGDKK